jgi:hypothetical protein
MSAAPRRQARPKGSPGANNVFQGLILKLILKTVKIKKLSLLWAMVVACPAAVAHGG